MDRRVNLASEHRGVYFLGEETLSARLRERAVLDEVACRANDNERKPGLIAAVGEGERSSYFVRLRKGEGRPAGAYLQSSGHRPSSTIALFDAIPAERQQAGACRSALPWRTGAALCERA
jgi:hypothetical protein